MRIYPGLQGLPIGSSMHFVLNQGGAGFGMCSTPSRSQSNVYNSKF